MSFPFVSGSVACELTIMVYFSITLFDFSPVMASMTLDH